MDSVTYCLRWNPVLKKPQEIMQPEEARIRHIERKPYSVVTNQPQAAVVDLTFLSAYCQLQFLDLRGRVVGRYSFVEVEDRLFLEQVTLHTYADDGERPSAGEIFRFGRDGTLTHDRGKPGGPLTRREGRVDVSANYVPIPEFGEYRDLLEKGLAS